MTGGSVVYVAHTCGWIVEVTL